MREPGYYWVRLKNAKYLTEFEVGYWGLSGWALTGLFHKYSDSDFQEIDERRITQSPLPSKCDHDFTAQDNKGFTICSKCGEQYT